MYSVVTTFIFLCLLETHVLGQFDPSIISVSPSTSCATIYDSNGTSKMNCDEATVIQIALAPQAGGGGFTYLFHNDAQKSPSGGAGKPVCDGDNPGTCLMGEDFIMQIDISPVKASYSLDFIGLDVPFGYAYANCLTRAAGYGYGESGGYNDFNKRNNAGPYPETVGDYCGPTMIYDLNDYQTCEDSSVFDLDSNGEEYSECIFECSVQKSKDNDKGIACQDESKRNNLHHDFTHFDAATGEQIDPENEHLMCRELPEYDLKRDSCMHGFPLPTTLCPCGGGITGTDAAAAAAVGSSFLAPVTACKSGTCAGTCGSAYPLDFSNVDGGAIGDDYCNPDDVESMCVNTNQKHRCLKCQPTIYKDERTEHAHKDRWCYYFDISNKFRCKWDSEFDTDTEATKINVYDVCGSGDYIMGGYNNPTRTQDDVQLHRDTRSCNCDANFVEKIYPVTPICSTYIIRDPPRYDYTIKVSFNYTEGENRTVPGSIMSVGGGWADWDLEFPPDISMPLSNYTSDGFAMTRILSVDSSTGKKGDDLHGYIVVCDNSVNPVCTTDTITDTIDQPDTDTNTGPVPINYKNLPTAHMDVSSVNGRDNPWGEVGVYDIFEEFEAKVPLPHLLYRYKDKEAAGLDPSLAEVKAVPTGTQKGSAADSQHQTWWYYVPEREMRNYCRGCGCLGYYPGGDSDAATAKTMCQGPQGTCVPGLDTLMRGEVVDPPCNIVSDYYKFLWHNGGAYQSYADKFYPDDANTDCHNPELASASARIPKHVPIDWDPQTPNYWVHGGRLFKDLSGREDLDLNIRLAVSVAADFEGEVITQEPGLISDTEPPPSCSLYADLGTGTLAVNVINTGTASAEYVLVTNCTQGIIPAPPQPFGLAPGVGGSANIQIIPLTIIGEMKWAPTQDQKDADILVPACSTSLYASLLAGKGTPMDITQPTLCIKDFGLPVIFPNYGPGVIEKAYTDYDLDGGIPGSGCSVFNPMCDQFGLGRRNGFSRAEQTLIVMMMILAVMSMVVCCYTGVVKDVAIQTGELQGYMAGLENSIQNTEGDSYASEKRVTELLGTPSG